MKNTLVLLLVVLLLISCSSFVYYPNSVNSPLLSEKNEMKFSAGIKGFGVDLRSAYAINDQIGVQINANAINIENTETIFGVSTDYRNGNYYGEAAIGYFNEIIPRLVFEAYAGTGIGRSFSRNLDFDELRTTMYSKLYLQQDIGYKSKIFHVGIAFREAFVNAYQTKINNIDQNISAFDFFFEPVIFLALGGEKFKINAQAGVSYASRASIINYPPFILSLGVERVFNSEKQISEK